MATGPRWRRLGRPLSPDATHVVDRPRGRVPAPLSKRWAVLKQQRTTILQLALASSVSWYIATLVFGHLQPFFAPIAAIITIIASVGQRRRTVIELILGVSLGILVGEIIISIIGRGGWQIGIVVALAVTAAIFLGLKGLARTQSATSAVLLAAVVPITGSGNPAINRFVDALVGGLIGVLISVVLPGNPVRKIDRDVQSVVVGLAQLLDLVAESLRYHDPGPAWTALQQGRAMQPTVEGLTSTVSVADEVSRISPIRWGQREHVRLYADAIRDIDNAVRDSRVLSRRVHTMLRQREASPEGMDLAVSTLARAVRTFGDDLAEQHDFDEARDLLVEAARAATRALPKAATMNTAATVAQIRSLAADLLYAMGASAPEVDEWLHFS
ncbi:FUSC family protein [Solicola sp. PLA-1-18]|uniref:FUSC family protein n=1 Tax=Solicola sp. PLA-1-18 TaxID=3380532 RepID=UPI003B7AAA92